MIDKSELQAKLLELISSANGPETVSEKFAEFMAYSVENYDGLDAEARALVDRALGELRKQAKGVIEQMPDGSQRRRFERVLGAVEGKHFRAENFLGGLESPTELTLEIIPAARSAFIEILQHVLDFLFDATSRIHQGFDIFSIAGLLYWAVDELLVGMHLAQRAFASQCYTHIRTVDEILDKIQLFHDQPKWTELWVKGSDEEVWKKLRPAEVRKKLGKPKHDPMYSFLSSLGPHGSFRGLQARTAMRAEPKEDGARVLMVWVGGTPQVGHIVWANAICVYSAMKTLAKCGAVMGGWLNEEEVSLVYKSCVDASRRFLLEHLVPWASGEGVDVGPMIEFLQKDPFEADL
jgi:hypothetical protein